MPAPNGDLSNWDVASVTDMYAIFYNASSFNSDLTNWDVSNVTNMAFMFSLSNLSRENYDNTLRLG
jgi:surface protein